MDETDKSKFVYNFGAVINPKCPYHGKIRKLRYGDHIFFRGLIHSNCQRFEFNLVGQRPNQKVDTALHFNPRFDQKCLVLNSTENRKWGPEERTKGTGPLKKGGRFEISFLVLDDKLRIAVNKSHYTDFNYRMPLSSINSVQLSGEVAIDSFHIQPSRETSQLLPKVTHLPQSPMKPPQEKDKEEKSPSGDGMEIEHLPVCYGYMLKVPYKAQIPGGMTEGRVIFATLIPSKASSRWTINLWTRRNSQRNLPLHFNVRHDERKVVLNSTNETATWQEEIIPSHMPVMCGRHIDVVIFCEKERYLISMSNNHFVEFKHRYTNLEDIKVVSVEGDCSLIHIRVQ